MSASPDHRESSSGEKLSARELIGFGSGGVAYNLGVDAIKNLANPVYNILLGLNPAWIGTVMMCARIWDAVTDPFMGTISDNCRSRRGRRRPFIFCGAILCAVTFPLIWMVPRGWGQTPVLIYFLVSSIIFYTCFTVYCVPYMTLSFELTPNYGERTRISAVRSMFAAVSSLLVTWVFRFAQLDIFEDPINGMRVAGIFIGVIFLVSGIPPALVAKERYQKLGQKQPKQRLFDSVKATMGKGPFRLLMGITVLNILGYNTFHALGIYVNTYYVCGGDIKMAATWQGWYGTMYVIALLAGIPLVTLVSKKLGKVKALVVCLGLGIAGGLANWFLYVPGYPFLQVLVPLLVAPCSAGFWVVVNSMKSDACDFDEHKTGMRREGAFASVSSWLQKFSAALTFSLSGLVLVLVGFDQSKGAEQAVDSIRALRLIFSFSPILFLSVCILLTLRLPFTPSRMSEVRAELERRRNPV